MKPYQQRVVDEKAELDERLEKLGAFILTHDFDLLDEAEKERLEWQQALMFKLSEVLGERIAAFTG